VVNVMLARLLKKGLIEKPVRGFYKWRDPGKKDIKDTAPDEVKFHGLTMEAVLTKLEGWSPLLTNANSPVGAEKMPQWIVEGNKKVFETSWRQRGVRVEVSERKVEVRLSASQNPLSIPELDAYFSFLEGLFFPNFYSYAWSLVHWGINVDHSEWWLDGATSITMCDARGYISRWYNKKGLGARQEVHGSVSIGLEQVINYIRGTAPLGVGDLRQKCDLLEEGIRVLSKDYRRMQVMLTKFVEILDEMNPRPTLLPYDSREGK